MSRQPLELSSRSLEGPRPLAGRLAFDTLTFERVGL